MKKLVSLLLALLMVMGMAFAEDVEEEEQVQTFALTRAVTYTVTINNDANGHTYEAYQIFAGDLSESTLSNIVWGNGVEPVALLEALKAETAFADCNTAADVAEVLTTIESDSDELRAFADVVAEHLATLAGSSTQAEGTYTLGSLAPGYYLIKDEDESLGDVPYDAYTSFILKVVKDVTVTPKSDTPEVEKTVNDANADIGDTVQFTLTATMPSTLAGYETYKIVFNDTMSKGLAYAENLKVTIDGVEVTEENYSVNTVVDETTGETTLTVTLEDALALGAKVNSKIVVTYDAIIDQDAVIGSEGNLNKVTLEYSNNPNAEGTGETPEKEVKVYTWEIPVFKYTEGENDAQKPLAGAGFTLYAEDGVTVINLVDAGNNIYKVCALPTCDHTHKTEVFTDETGRFEIEGLDLGTYVLKETATPAGYNTVADTTVVVGENGVLTIEGATVTEVQILNQAGSTLPETGGMGTTLLYAVGGVLMLVAFVLIVSKRRASEN